MGFDFTRFIGEVDEEFNCSICEMVLEDPMQLPCDHLFCKECINGWLAVNKSCPVDRASLQLVDLKPAARFFCNLLDKFDMKCAFRK